MGGGSVGGGFVGGSVGGFVGTTITGALVDAGGGAATVGAGSRSERRSVGEGLTTLVLVGTGVAVKPVLGIESGTFMARANIDK